MKRSTTAILLKNLPYESDESELREMCERFGSVARFVLPSTRTLAVVEWLEVGSSSLRVPGILQHPHTLAASSTLAWPFVPCLCAHVYQLSSLLSLLRSLLYGVWSIFLSPLAPVSPLSSSSSLYVLQLKWGTIAML